MSMSESRRRKLQMLTRAIAKGDMGKAQKLLQSGPPAGPDSPAAAPRPKQAAPVPLETACPGTVQRIATPGGEATYWAVRKRLREIDPQSEAARQSAAVLRGARQRFDELSASAALCHAAAARPEDLLFMDIESCGLYGASVFLVGMMFHDRGDLAFEQHLARDYREEAAIIRAFFERRASAGVLVTFNGKAFDMNMLRDRAAFHGMDVPGARECPPHLDLLYECRRRWRGKLPDCRLQTLEQHLCSRRRMGDIPGWAIPDAYHRFVDTADARELRDIMHHNLLDLLTMAELLTLILAGGEPAA